jgi:TRAP-type C4-dicarboxylate transport system permease small subunit
MSEHSSTTLDPVSKGLDAIIRFLNAIIVFFSMIAIALAGAILSWEASARYLFKIPSDWQDEVTIFLLVGATFLSCAWVQRSRGHIGIQALAAVLSPRVNLFRIFLSDVMSFLFCTFFAWKSWTLLLEAIEDHQISGSAFGAPLWIPYSTMAIGTSLLSLVLLAQVLQYVFNSPAHHLSQAAQPSSPNSLHH